MILAVAFNGAAAQSGTMPGAVFGVSGGTDYGMIIPINEPNEYRDFQHNVLMSRGGIYMIFPKLFFTEGFGITTSFNYTQFNLKASGETLNQLELGGSPTTGMVDVEYEYNSHAIGAELLVYWHMGDLARMEVGPWGTFGFLPSYNQTSTVLDPNGATFPGLGPQRFESGTDPTSFTINGGMMLRASLEIPMPLGMAIVPSGSLRASAFSIDAGNQMGVFMSAGLGLGVLFDRTNAEPSAPMEPIAKLDTIYLPSASPALTVSIDLFTADSTGSRSDTLYLTTVKTLHRLEAPLPGRIMFEPKSAALSTRYVQYSPGMRDHFSLDSLAGRDAIEVSRHELNVVGARMRGNSSSRLTVTGYASKEEPKWFAEARAEAVARYLGETWEIPEGRITTAAGQGTGDLRAVELSSSTSGLLDPAVVRWVEEEVRGTPIGLEPRMTADSGIKGWRVTLLYQGKELAVVRSGDGSSTSMLDVATLLSGIDVGSGSQVLEAELVAEDSAGGIRIARDRMVMQVAGDATSHLSGQAGIGRTFTRYIVLDLSPAQIRRSIEHIAASIRDDSARVSIATRVDPAESVLEGKDLAELQGQLIEACRRNGVTLADDRVLIASDRSADAEGGLYPESIEITISQNHIP